MRCISGSPRTLPRVSRSTRTSRTLTASPRYGIDTLVHVEVYDLVVEAMRREKQLKGWKRAWKIALIEKNNPDWREPKLDWRDLA